MDKESNKIRSVLGKNVVLVKYLNIVWTQMIIQKEPFITRTTTLSELKLTPLSMARNPWYTNQTNQDDDLTLSVKLRVLLRTKIILELWH